MKLEQSQIKTELQHVAEWQLSGDEIKREWKFAEFGDAMVFVNRVAELAQAANHHPDIDIRYNRVLLALSSHDAGGLTKKDFRLAREIDEI